MAKKKPIIVVTGATGFVGRCLVERLLREDQYHIRCLVRTGSDIEYLQSLDGNLSFAVGDILLPQTLEPALKGAWGLVNLAGYREFWSQDRDQYYQLNEQGAINVFQACLDAGVTKVVQVSTPLAYGVPSQIPFDEDTRPGGHPSEYARSKYRGDEAGWHLHREQQLPLTVVYLAAVIGAGDDKSTMEVRRAVEKKLPALVGANTTYTYVYVQDAADAIARALMKKDSVGRRYLIGNQRATTREYFTKIGELADVPIPSWNIPEPFLIPVARAMEWVSSKTGVRPQLPLDVLKTTAAGSLLFDASRGIEELGMEYTPLETALAESIAEIRPA